MFTADCINGKENGQLVLASISLFILSYSELPALETFSLSNPSFNSITDATIEGITFSEPNQSIFLILLHLTVQKKYYFHLFQILKN